MPTPALGYIPPMTKGITDDPAYVIPLVEMLEEEGIESVWPQNPKTPLGSSWLFVSFK